MALPNLPSSDQIQNLNDAIQTFLNDGVGLKGVSAQQLKQLNIAVQNILNNGVKAKGNKAKEPFADNVNTEHIFTQPMNGFVITNDGAADLTFTISGDTYIVKPNEVFIESFEPFTQVNVITIGAFRAYGLG